MIGALATSWPGMCPGAAAPTWYGPAHSTRRLASSGACSQPQQGGDIGSTACRQGLAKQPGLQPRPGEKADSTGPVGGTEG